MTRDAISAIEVYKEDTDSGMYESVGTKSVRKSGKVDFWDGSHACTRTAYKADDGTIWVMLDGQYHTLDEHMTVIDGIFAEREASND